MKKILGLFPKRGQCLSRVSAPPRRDTGVRRKASDCKRDKALGELHRAAAEGDAAKMEQMLLMGEVELEALDKYNRTPLHLASAYGYPGVVTLLVERKCQLDPYDLGGVTPLIEAIKGQQQECTAILLRHGADPNFVDVFDNNTPLHYAAYGQNTAILINLLQYSCNIEAQNKDGYTPLLFAVEGNNKDMVEILLKHGANVNAVERNQRTALMIAASRGQLSIVRLLTQYDADLSYQDKKGWTAERYALAGSFTIYRHLVEYRASREKCIHSDMASGSASGGLTMNKEVVEEISSEDCMIGNLFVSGPDDHRLSTDAKSESDTKKLPKSPLKTEKKIEKSSPVFTEVKPFSLSSESEREESFPKVSYIDQDSPRTCQPSHYFFSKIEPALLEIDKEFSTEEMESRALIINGAREQTTHETPNIPSKIDACSTSEIFASRKELEESPESSCDIEENPIVEKKGNVLTEIIVGEVIPSDETPSISPGHQTHGISENCGSGQSFGFEGEEHSEAAWVVEVDKLETNSPSENCAAIQTLKNSPESPWDTEVDKLETNSPSENCATRQTLAVEDSPESPWDTEVDELQTNCPSENCAAKQRLEESPESPWDTEVEELQTNSLSGNCAARQTLEDSPESPWDTECASENLLQESLRCKSSVTAQTRDSISMGQLEDDAEQHPDFKTVQPAVKMKDSFSKQEEMQVKKKQKSYYPEKHPNLQTIKHTSEMEDSLSEQQVGKRLKKKQVSNYPEKHPNLQTIKHNSEMEDSLSEQEVGNRLMKKQVSYYLEKHPNLQTIKHTSEMEGSLSEQEVGSRLKKKLVSYYPEIHPNLQTIKDTSEMEDSLADQEVENRLEKKQVPYYPEMHPNLQTIKHTSEMEGSLSEQEVGNRLKKNQVSYYPEMHPNLQTIKHTSEMEGSLSEQEAGNRLKKKQVLYYPEMHPNLQAIKHTSEMEDSLSEQEARKRLKKKQVPYYPEKHPNLQTIKHTSEMEDSLSEQEVGKRLKKKQVSYYPEKYPNLQTIKQTNEMEDSSSEQEVGKRLKEKQMSLTERILPCQEDMVSSLTHTGYVTLDLIQQFEFKESSEEKQSFNKNNQEQVEEEKKKHQQNEAEILKGKDGDAVTENRIIYKVKENGKDKENKITGEEISIMSISSSKESSAPGYHILKGNDSAMNLKTVKKLQIDYQISKDPGISTSFEQRHSLTGNLFHGPNNSRLTGTDNDEERSAKKILNEKNEGKIQKDAYNLNDLTESPDKSIEDYTLTPSISNYIMILIEQLCVNCKDSIKLLEIQDIIFKYERSVELKKRNCTLLTEKVKSLEKKIIRLQEKLSETKKMKSQLSQLENQKSEWDRELCSIRFTPKEEEEKTCNAEILCKKQSRTKEKQYNKETEPRQQLESSHSTLILELTTVKSYLKQVKEERTEALRQLSQEKSARTLQERILNDLTKQREKEAVASKRILSLKVADSHEKEKHLLYKIHRLEKEVAVLKLAQKGGKIKDKEKGIHRYIKENEILKEKNDELNKELKVNEERLRKTIHQFSEQINILTSENAILNSKLKNEKQNRVRTETKIESCHSHLTPVGHCHEESQTSKVDLSHNFQQEQAHCLHLQDRINCDLYSLRDNTSVLSQEFSNAENTVNTSKDELSLLYNSLREKTLTLESTHSELKQAQDKVKVLQERVQMEEEKWNQYVFKQESNQDGLIQMKNENTLFQQQPEDVQNQGIINERLVLSQLKDCLRKFHANNEKQALIVEEILQKLINELNYLRAQIYKYENKKAEIEIEELHSETEVLKCKQLGSKNQNLQEDLIFLKKLEKKNYRLEEYVRKWEEEVKKQKLNLEMAKIKYNQVEQYKRELEKEARQQILEIQKEATLIIQIHGLYQKKLKLRENDFASVRNQKDDQIRDLEYEVFTLKKSLQDSKIEEERYRQLLFSRFRNQK